MAIATNNEIKASDANSAGQTIKNNLIAYEIRRQALLENSVWNNTTPSGGAVVYNGSYSLSTVNAVQNNAIGQAIIKQYVDALKSFNTRMQSNFGTIIQTGDLKDNYLNTIVEAKDFNNLNTILSRAYSLLSAYDYYTNYTVGSGTCKRSCQTSCQTACQKVCQGYHQCHNQRCGTH